MNEAEAMKELFGISMYVPRINPLYTAYRAGEYVPNEARPVITIPGRRIWWAPWRRRQDEILFGMSEAMAFRAQDAQLRYGAP